MISLGDCPERFGAGVTDEVFAKELCSHYPELRRSFMMRTDNPEVADDLTQKTAFLAWRGRRNFRGDSSVATWLDAIAKNVFFEHVRSLRRKRRYEVSRFDDREGEKKLHTVPDPVPLADELVSAQEEIDLALDEISRMPTLLRHSYLLAVFFCLTYPQIAALQGVTENTVGNRVFRAYGVLRMALAVTCERTPPTASQLRRSGRR